MNYTVSLHTHTPRCKHAWGEERKYIEYAIAGGLTTLGFADHAPYEFPPPYVSGFRMRLSDADDYFETLLALREEYKDRIDIKIGFEAEYYPALFESFIESIAHYPIDYLILGQHYLDNEKNARYSGFATDSEELLCAYVDQVTAGIDTGVFTYVAHPELFFFTGADAVYERHYSRLIEHAAALGMPLEINLLGIRDYRHYPDERFIALCGKLGASMCVGADAHEPSVVVDQKSFAKAAALMEKMGREVRGKPDTAPGTTYLILSAERNNYAKQH